MRARALIEDRKISTGGSIFMRHEFLESDYAWLADYFSDYYELADLLNCSTRTVSRIMSGQRRLTHREQTKICEYLGITNKF